MPQNPKITVETFFETLGNDSQLIRERLVSMGIKGIIGDPGLCVIAIAVHKACGAQNVTMGSDHLWYKKGGRIIEVNPGSAVVKFVSEFDRKQYPELIGTTYDRQP